jgi:hypothetical protein
MSHSLERLLRLRSDLEAQVEDLESGRVKVLRLYDGGSSDEDCSKEQLETLYGHLDEIEVILRESGIRSNPQLEPRASHAMSPMVDSIQLVTGRVRLRGCGQRTRRDRFNEERSEKWGSGRIHGIVRDHGHVRAARQRAG